MRVYDQLKKKQSRLFLVLVAVFVIIATTIGPLSNRFSSPLLAVLSWLAIAVFVGCMVLIGRLGFRCPRCGTFHSINTMTSAPHHCPKCGEDLTSL